MHRHQTSSFFFHTKLLPLNEWFNLFWFPIMMDVYLKCMKNDGNIWAIWWGSLVWRNQITPYCRELSYYPLGISYKWRIISRIMSGSHIPAPLTSRLSTAASKLLTLNNVISPSPHGGLRYDGTNHLLTIFPGLDECAVLCVVHGWPSLSMSVCENWLW